MVQRLPKKSSHYETSMDSIIRSLHTNLNFVSLSGFRCWPLAAIIVVSWYAAYWLCLNCSALLHRPLKTLPCQWPTEDITDLPTMEEEENEEQNDHSSKRRRYLSTPANSWIIAIISVSSLKMAGWEDNDEYTVHTFICQLYQVPQMIVGNRQYRR